MRPAWLVGIIVAGVATVIGFGISPAHAAIRVEGHFTFIENQAHPDLSRLYFVVQRTDLSPPRTLLNANWRAGSGDGDTNECHKDHGWLPKGTYDVFAWNNHQGVITGHAFQLSDKVCSNGRTPRTALFIHTSHPWTSDKRYHSEGCIKLNNNDINTAYYDFTRYFAINKWYGGMLTVQ
jgi:hypothetical protein